MKKLRIKDEGIASEEIELKMSGHQIVVKLVKTGIAILYLDDDGVHVDKDELRKLGLSEEVGYY